MLFLLLLLLLLLLLVRAAMLLSLQGYQVGHCCLLVLLREACQLRSLK
jgi:hypothetical protein